MVYINFKKKINEFLFHSKLLFVFPQNEYSNYIILINIYY